MNPTRLAHNQILVFLSTQIDILFNILEYYLYFSDVSTGEILGENSPT